MSSWETLSLCVCSDVQVVVCRHHAWCVPICSTIPAHSRYRSASRCGWKTRGPSCDLVSSWSLGRHSHTDPCPPAPASCEWWNGQGHGLRRLCYQKWGFTMQVPWIDLRCVSIRVDGCCKIMILSSVVWSLKGWDLRQDNIGSCQCEKDI